MRYNLSKTKRRPRSNKKGALKGLRNNKTKVVKKRRIEQRGGGKFSELIDHILKNNTVAVANCIREEIEPSLYHKFVAMNSGHGRMVQFTGPTALYTACSLPDPNPNLVNTLLFFGFNPNTPNNDRDRSYPQHGVVAAAGAIIRSGDDPYKKKQKLGRLVNVLGSLRNYGAHMEYKNIRDLTAMGEYITENQGHNSIYDILYTSSDQELNDLGKSIHNLLDSATPYVPPPPSVHVVKPSEDALPPCDLSELPESQHYSIEPNSSFGFKSKYYFIYNGKHYYFCANINNSIDKEFRKSTMTGQPSSINRFEVTNVDTDRVVPTTFNFSYKRSQIPAVGMSIHYLGPERVSFNIEGDRCSINDAAVGIIKQS